MMRLKKQILAITAILFCSFPFYGQYIDIDNSDSTRIRKAKIKLKRDRWYFPNSKPGEGQITYTYYNRKGIIDSTTYGWAEGVLEVRSYYKYDEDGELIQQLKYNLSYDTTYTIHFPKKEWTRRSERDSKGNVVVTTDYRNNELHTKTLFHYDSASQFIGREVYDARGKIILSDKKTFSKTGKLLTWYGYDQTKKITSYRKQYYDAYDELILELDSSSVTEELQKIHYDYITINNSRQLKSSKTYMGKRLNYQTTYSYRLNKDGSFTQLVRLYYYPKQGFRKVRNKGLYYYSPGNKLVKSRSNYQNQKEYGLFYYTNDEHDSCFHYEKGKLVRISKYHLHNDAPIGLGLEKELQLSQKGDTLSYEEYSYNELHFLIKSRNLLLNQGDYKPSDGPAWRDEHLIEYAYEYY